MLIFLGAGQNNNSPEIEALRKDLETLKNRVKTIQLENEKLSDDLLLSQEQIAMVNLNIIVVLIL